VQHDDALLEALTDFGLLHLPLVLDARFVLCGAHDKRHATQQRQRREGSAAVDSFKRLIIFLAITLGESGSFGLYQM
jgi:hypothetical protein